MAIRPKTPQGSHEFSYVVCEDTIPSHIITSTRTKAQIIADIKAAVDEWKATVIWDRGGVNIITTRPLPDSTPCADPPTISGILSPQTNNQVMFASDRQMAKALCFNAGGCWRSPTWEARAILDYFRVNVRLPAIEPGSVLLPESYGASWYGVWPTGCTVLHETVVHEAGHAFGIGWPLNRHPSNQMHSAMSEEGDMHFCEPQAYDIVAVMANYQSR